MNTNDQRVRKTEIQGLEKTKSIIYQEGRLYYTKDFERKLFFILTLVMLIAGIGYKLVAL